MCFVDDLILFSTRDYRSVTMLLQGIKLFAKSSSLVANKS